MIDFVKQPYIFYKSWRKIILQYLRKQFPDISGQTIQFIHWSTIHRSLFIGCNRILKFQYSLKVAWLVSMGGTKLKPAPVMNLYNRRRMRKGTIGCFILDKNIQVLGGYGNRKGIVTALATIIIPEIILFVILSKKIRFLKVIAIKRYFSYCYLNAIFTLYEHKHSKNHSFKFLKQI